MKHELDIHRFRELKTLSANVVCLRQRVASILQRRSLRSFDGFGHFLDAVLGDDEQSLDALAQTVRLPSSTIDQLRASELDPFANSFDKVAYVAFLLGMENDEFLRLANIDHSRFARHSDSVFARSGVGSDSTNAADRIKQLWGRFEEDRGTEL